MITQEKIKKIIAIISAGDLYLARYLLEKEEKEELSLSKFKEEIEDLDEKNKKGLSQISRAVKEFLDKPLPKDGKPGPSGSRGRDGSNGKDGSPGPRGPAGEPGPAGIGEMGPPGKDGKPGPAGPSGPAPAHHWNGTLLRFQNPDGSWSDYHNLQGPPGPAGMAFPGEMGGTGALERVRGSGIDVQGVSQIYFGTNLTVTKLGDGSIRVDALGGGGGGTWYQDEIPTGTKNGVNKTFTLDHIPGSVMILTVNGIVQNSNASSPQGADYARSGDTITMTIAPLASDNFLATYS